VTGKKLVVLIDSDMGSSEIELAACESAGLDFFDGRFASPEQLTTLLREASGVLVQYRVVDEAFLDRCPRLLAIVTYGVGTDHIDTTAAAARGIGVLPVRDYCVDEVADHTLALVLACMRRIVPLSLAVRSGVWPGTQDFGTLRTMRDSTYAVIGLGSIGQAVAVRALAFGTAVCVHDPYVDAGLCESFGLTQVSLEDAFSCDIVSLHVPLMDSTAQMVTGRLLDRMPPHGILVNVSRGGVIVEHDLLERVESGRINAGLDVLTVEPPSDGDALASSHRVIITPHVAWYSTSAEDRLCAQAGTLMSRFLAEPLRNVKGTT
jgi:D-3-phosphoglycerate dehydrogenase / 2-oxoglutarate reductase